MSAPDELRREIAALRARISDLGAASLRISASLDLETVLLDRKAGVGENGVPPPPAPAAALRRRVHRDLRVGPFNPFQAVYLRPA